MNKYKNKKTIVDGIVFDSKHEAECWCQLKLLERCGLISDLKRQVPFELIAPRRINGKAVRGVYYVADFVYKNADGETVVEDAKGYRTDVYRLKKRAMLLLHDIDITEV